MSDKNPLDNYFKSSLKNHEVKASPEVWERVVAGAESESNRGTLWFFMRAAVVVLMISVGTWYMVDFPGGETGGEDSPDKEVTTSQTNAEQKGSERTTKETPPTGIAKISDQGTDDEKKQKAVMPVAKQSQSRSTIYVSHEPLKEVDERALFDNHEMRLATISLDPAQLAAYGRPKPSMKVRVGKPVTESAFYSDGVQPEEDPKLKTKLYAYANTQFDNIKNGRPVELPKTGKPQLQINLNKIFNN